ncbi:MAG: exodeoxyribonuclease VII large subunit [Planctomycetaceae bacterium]|nr:exodeoxyribonuclease VII large subunit [Planctomycetaceae bacterium]
MPAPPILTVAQVTRQIKDAVEGNFPQVFVLGEVSNCTLAGSGHIYFTLKDDAAQLRAVIWRNTAARLRFDVRDGLEVIAAGPVEVYEARGAYQLIVEQLVPQGVGALELAFRQMCAKLEAEGLFDPERKRPLPRFPRRIALVTSPTGAAVRDMLQVITRRWPAVDLVIVPVAVQGEGAAAQIAAALRSVHRIPQVDVVIAGRGGGSLEDLWAFNEEIVARALFECPIPVVSAVGHEIDVTIADLVADRRALTPSEAGELVVPHRDEVLADLARLTQRLMQGLRSRSAAARAQLDALASRRVLTRPLERLHDESRRLDELDLRMQRALKQRVERARQQLAANSAALSALSPLKVLERGYSVTHRGDTGAVVRSADQVAPGETIRTRLHSGEVLSRVEQIAPR